MLDLDDLVADCVDAVAEPDPRRATRAVLERVLAGGQLANALREPTGGLNVLYNAPDLTVLNVVWPPFMSLFPHNHDMWAAIGIYAGREDNTFYRRQGSTLVTSGGKALADGDVVLLGDDTIHAVHNPARAYTGAIHVYGGDFVTRPRSQWDAVTLEECPYDYESVRREFDRAERQFHATDD
jgi:predicted metal-dependent enzyme (double-stranded beta helix superfamily)